MTEATAAVKPSRCDNCTVDPEVRRNTHCCEQCTPENPQSQTENSRVFLVGSHSTTIPNLSSYRVTKYPNGTYRCTCRNFIFNRDKPDQPEDKHIADAKAKSDNVSEITNLDMKAVLIHLENVASIIEKHADLPDQPTVWFGHVRDTLRAHEYKLTGADQAYLMTEITGAETFWMRFDQKRRQIDHPEVKASGEEKKKTGVYFL